MKYTKNHIKLKCEQKYIRKGIGLLVRKTNQRQKEKSIIHKKATTKHGWVVIFCDLEKQPEDMNSPLKRK